jgi:branched-chain amino acid transport system ATP-binding protein
MLAVARALAGGPKVLLLDEPLEGLAPIVIEALFDALIKIRDETGLTIILIEQKAELALAFANDCIVIDRGKIVHSGPSELLKADTELQARLLGVSH